ncbi:phage tail tube protein [Streptomyces sp. NBC_00525]|uniref:phage tail tube protein n=1 Tax=Streptomyces sp. NBC_00525 TaxID=2903660 RepID=UPI002E81EC0F|nr:phage tail tube protein [Streptomyces sp. NBC_00525]WUC97417.1 phage tail protein [Streptomyces sp. NBC_00525]
MAKMVLTSEYVGINSVDYSDNVRKAELTVEVEDKDVTTFGSDGWTEVLGGLKSGELKVEFLQDFAAGQVDEDMWALLGSVVTFEVRPTSAVVGTSNPKFTGSILVNGWNPIEGGVGDEASVSVSFPVSGAVTRATS